MTTMNLWTLLSKENEIAFVYFQTIGEDTIFPNLCISCFPIDKKNKRMNPSF